MTDHPTTPSWAVPGARVVAVNNWEPGYATHAPGSTLDVGKVYVLGRYRIEVHGDLWVDLRGEDIRFCWPITNFRPAVEPKSQAEDAAMFERIAHGTTIVERLDLLREKLDA